jgi:hypothetical protein
MGRLCASLLVFLLGGGAAVVLASCGSGGDADLLPGTTASEINSNLDEVERLVAEGDCVGAEDAVAEVTAEVEDLREVDLKLKAALEEGTNRLSEVVVQCEETSEEETEPALEPDVEAEDVEDTKKPKKEKPDKEAEEPAETDEEGSKGEGTSLPPQSNGKGEDKGQGGGPGPSETETEEAPSGGVGPSVGVEE